MRDTVEGGCGWDSLPLDTPGKRGCEGSGTHLDFSLILFYWLQKPTSHHWRMSHSGRVFTPLTISENTMTDIPKGYHINALGNLLAVIPTKSEITWKFYDQAMLLLEVIFKSVNVVFPRLSTANSSIIAKNSQHPEHLKTGSSIGNRNTGSQQKSLSVFPSRNVMSHMSSRCVSSQI